MISTGTERRVALVEDSAVQRQVLGAFLRELGLEVELAETADEALELLVRSRPDAVLSDLVLPGMDGFALCRTIKDDPRLAEIPVVLLTSTRIDDSDHELARRSGAETLVARTPGFSAIAEAALTAVGARGARFESSATGPGDGVLTDLRRGFLREGRATVRDLLARWEDEALDLEEVERLAHRWAGRAGTLGFPAIGRRARDLERRVVEGDVATARDAMVTLGQLFAEGSETEEPTEPAVPQGPDVAGHVFDALHGRRIALIGFTRAESDRMTDAFARVRAESRRIEWSEGVPGSPRLDPYDLVVLAAHGEPEWSPWLADEATDSYEAPLLLVGGPEMLIREPPRGSDRHLLLAPWSAEGLLLRAWMAIRSGAPASPSRDASDPLEVVLADDDPTIVALVQATLRNSGIRCHAAEDGSQALELARRVHPSAMIVDINMPRTDGYEVLAAMKADRRSRRVPVVLLTARQQEADIVRGFELGAAEYIVKPFNPMELVARLRRLLA